MEIIHFLQQFDHPAVYLLMRVFSFLGDAPFYLFILPILYWCWNREKSVPFMMIVLSELVLNYILKDLFHTPRPQDLAMVDSTGLGFPSGHAQNAVVVFGYLAWLGRNRSYYWWAGVVIFFIGLSRLYLGVHFPADVVGGWFLGFLWLVFCIWVKNYLERNKVQFPMVPTIGIIFLITTWITVFVGDSEIAKAAGAMSGLFTGAIITQRWLPFEAKGTPFHQGFKVLLGLSGVFILDQGLDFILPLGRVFMYSHYSLLGLWISWGSVWIFMKLQLIGTRKNVKEAPAR